MNYDSDDDDLLLDCFDGYNDNARWDLAVLNINLINNFNWIYNKYNIKI